MTADSTRPGMVHIKGGSFVMGSDRHYAEEGPARTVAVDDFLIDAAPVTNAEFARFVEETGHVTLAETPPDPADYPGIRPEMIRAGSLVFVPTAGPVDLSNAMQWWAFRFGADWRHPTGPGSTIDGLDAHPVVHIAYADALAYATWCGKSLPTEAQWEYAARGGRADGEFAWGDELMPGGAAMANFWQGEFPHENLLLDGYERTSPVGAYPPNGYGLYDMIGNVWEWTSDWYQEGARSAPSPCCVPQNPRGGTEPESFDPRMPDIRIGRRATKGGSHLCAPNYCQRYRPAARSPQTVDTSTSHLGFRCVVAC